MEECMRHIDTDARNWADRQQISQTKAKGLQAHKQDRVWGQGRMRIAQSTLY
jgi:hypothetical protein